MILFGLMMACGPGSMDTAEPECYRDPPLTYHNFGKGYMDLHCNGCHSSLLPEHHRVGAPTGVSFDTYTEVMNWVDRIDTRSNSVDFPMPPGGGPTEKELKMFNEWLYCTVREDMASFQQAEE